MRNILERCDAEADLELFVNLKKIGSERPSKIEYHPCERKALNSRQSTAEIHKPVKPTNSFSPSNPRKSFQGNKN